MRRMDGKHVRGSALILTVVLTSLLAIIGIMFVMAANMDKLTTSSVSINKELGFAVDSVVSQISQELILDIPGVAPAMNTDYYDYPGDADHWLANLEPYRDGNDYKWSQISKLSGSFQNKDITAIRIDEREAIRLDPNGDIDRNFERDRADADGDGVADSKWIELEAGSNQPAMTKSGKRIYTAIRIIDNGAMLNVNTVYRDPGTADQRRGDELTDIYIDGLRKNSPSNDIGKFLNNRGDPGTAHQYHLDVSRRIENPDTTSRQYILYDISEELSLRNRYVIYNRPTMTRLEAQDPPLQCFYNSLRHTNAYTPVDDPCAFDNWKRRMNPDDQNLDPADDDNHYSFRKLLTTYNFDRIINPDGQKMVNINQDSADSIQAAIANAILDADPGFPQAQETAAQITANLIDYRDGDSDVTVFPYNGTPYYGFERPCIYISELAYKIASWIDNADPPNTWTGRSYAIELYMPDVNETPDSAQWHLRVGTREEPINWTPGKDYHVVIIEDSLLENTPSPPMPACAGIIESDVASVSSKEKWAPPHIDARNQWVELLREVDGTFITVDKVQFPSAADPLPGICDSESVKRDINPHKCIRRLLSNLGTPINLGSANNYTDPDPNLIQAHPADRPFTNVGDIGMLFRKCAYAEDTLNCIASGDTEADARVNLAVAPYQRIFEHLTVFDPNSDGIDNDGDGPHDATETSTPEYKIPGRINMNTAPWYVIAQLPWVTNHLSGTNRYDLAKAFVAYRDKGGPNYSGRAGNYGFENISELNLVTAGADPNRIDFYQRDGMDLTGYPDLTSGDGAIDDFEERDVIFSRISNLVTVRSDVFTAYILVRLGVDGPQKRVIAILDRSDVYPSTGKVKIVALWPVPDSR